MVAPAGPAPDGPLEAGCAWLAAQGFTLQRSLPERPQGYLAGPDTERAALLQAALTTPHVDAVWAARGGYGLHRILDLLDWSALRQARPRWVVGFSDITALLLPLSSRAPAWGVVHGPNVTTLPQVAPADTEGLLRLLRGEAPEPLEGLTTLQPGRARGPLLVGNLCLITHLLGSPYLPPAAGRVVVLEEVGEAPYRVDRMLCALHLAGWFEGAAGVVLGELRGCQAAGVDAGEVATELLRRWLPAGTPVAAGAPVGHGERCAPLREGAPYRLVAGAAGARLAPARDVL